MKNVVVCMPNSLLAGGIVMQLKKNSDFRVFREDEPEGIEDFCISVNVDVLLVEVRELSPYTLEEWLERYRLIKANCSHSRFAVIVDEGLSPKLAKQVAKVRSVGVLIDAFVYGSVTGEYLSAVIDSL